MTEKIVTATTIGSLAHKILNESKDAIILGTTSRGIFLRMHNRWVIFISYEADRGPLTLNLKTSKPTPIETDKNQAIEIQSGKIIFPKSNLQIEYSHAEEYQISPHPHLVLSVVERDERIRATGQAVIAGRGGIGLVPVLANLLETEFSRLLDQPAWVDRIDHRQMQRNLRSPEEAQIISQLQPFLGLGSGLTPSGDDLINGFLLTYNRYHDILHPPFSLSSVNQAIVERAYQKTSLLSANLIECATLGLADERLIQALDGMLAGTLNPASCANRLFRWGNSSGCDALVGMVLAAYQSP